MVSNTSKLLVKNNIDMVLILLKNLKMLLTLLGYRKSTKEKREKAKEAKANHAANQNQTTPISPNTGSDAPPSNLTTTSGANGDSEQQVEEESTSMAE